MRVALALLVSAWLLLTSCASASPTRGRTYLQPGRYEQDLPFGGRTRHFILRIPKKVDTTSPAPLVIVLHGWTLSARQAESYTRMADRAETSGFIVAFPDGIGKLKGWNAGFINLTGEQTDDVGFIGAVIDKIESESDIDVDRVYVAGHSNGAFLAEDLGARMGLRLAAIGSVAGSIGIPTDTAGHYSMIPKPEAPVSVIEIHSLKDSMVAYDNESVALLKCYPAPQAAKWWANQDGCAASPTVTESADGSVETTIYSGGRGGVEVELVTLKNGSHDWPGGIGPDGADTKGGFDAARALWDFFAAHPKKPVK